MSTDSAGLHADRREGQPAWRNPVANQVFDGFDPHTKVVSDSGHQARAVRLSPGATDAVTTSLLVTSRVESWCTADGLVGAYSRFYWTGVIGDDFDSGTVDGWMRGHLEVLHRAARALLKVLLGSCCVQRVGALPLCDVDQLETRIGG